MRLWAIFLVLFGLVPQIRAQRQESSLVDRLLRPNMDLQNKAQGKKFAANSAVVENRGTVGTFYLPPNRSEKSFASPRDYPTSEHSTRSFSSSSRSIVSTQNPKANTAASLGTSEVRDIRAAHDAQRSVATREYAEQPQFKERGKSQKSLDRQNPPLTIDQVRELLNKNK
jgi:hypothetical protein